MNTMYDDESRRLLEVLHRGFARIENLALEAGHQEIADLADALEIVPLIMCGVAGDEALLHFVLENYREHYPDGAHYVLHSWIPEPVAVPS